MPFCSFVAQPRWQIQIIPHFLCNCLLGKKRPPNSLYFLRAKKHNEFLIKWLKRHRRSYEICGFLSFFWPIMTILWKWMGFALKNGANANEFNLFGKFSSSQKDPRVQLLKDFHHEGPHSGWILWLLDLKISGVVFLWWFDPLLSLTKETSRQTIVCPKKAINWWNNGEEPFPSHRPRASQILLWPRKNGVQTEAAAMLN